MSIHWYVITGDINLNNFNNLWTQERGIIWRGYTHEYEMIPSAANYNIVGKKITDYRTEICQPSMEIERISLKIHELNKFQKFPFEIPLLIRKTLFYGYLFSEEKLFKQEGIDVFPSSLLAQAMSIVQHEFGGTSLLDFSTNKYKGLYFALGKNNNFFKDSYLFGLNTYWLETHKNEIRRSVFCDKDEKQFDLVYPSYSGNSRIANQEGVFIYQKFQIKENGYTTEERTYVNILEYLKSLYDEGRKHGVYDNMSIDNLKENFDAFYILLKIPAKEKPKLKVFLNSIGITDNFMMNTILRTEPKIEYPFEAGDGI
jgi:hypothetical protein